MTRYVIIFVLTITTVSCKNKLSKNEKASTAATTNSKDKVVRKDNEDYPNDKYCADVKYYNSHTGTQSSYRLTVDVENNRVVELDFPNGGKLDHDHFSGANLDDAGNATFTSDKGYDYEVQIIGQTTNCFDGIPMVKQCRGVTKAGRQCKHLTDNAKGLCWQHQNQEN